VQAAKPSAATSARVRRIGVLPGRRARPTKVQLSARLSPAQGRGRLPSQRPYSGEAAAPPVGPGARARGRGAARRVDCDRCRPLPLPAGVGPDARPRSPFASLRLIFTGCQCPRHSQEAAFASFLKNLDACRRGVATSAAMRPRSSR
jgi:hypothetical protein